MSSWVPLRSAPSEPLCPPSTSYAAAGVATCSARLRGRRCAGQLHRRRVSQIISCQTSQALQSYHNAYKLLHQPARTAEQSPATDAPSRQRQKTRSRVSQPTSGPLDATPQPPPQQSEGPATEQRKFPGGGQRSTRAAAHSTSSTALNGAPSSTGTSGDPGSSSSSTNPIHTNRGSSSSSSASNGGEGGIRPEMEDLRPYVPHSVSLPHWQPPPTSLQHRTALTRAITACPSYTRLHQLILDNAADFNCYHSCAALNRVLALHAAGLTPRESRLFKEGCSTLQTILRRQLPELQPRSVVVAAYSLARLELPDRELLAGLAAAVEPHLNALQPKGLSSLLWSFARQNHQPPPKWMDALLSACAADLVAFEPRDMATVIWALARLHYKVAPARLKQLLEHALARMGSFCGRSLSNVVYSLARSQQHPGTEWLEAAQARAVALGTDAFSPQGMTQMAWGLSKLGAKPTHAFLGLVLEHASQRLPQSPQERLRERDRESPQQQRQGGGSGDGSTAGSPRQRRVGRYSGLDLSTLLYSLASLAAQPPADMGRRLLAAVQWELPSLEANGMCNCLWACARLRLYPTKMWLSAFFDASYRQLPYFKPVDLSQTLWALARLQARPPSAWMSLVMTRLQHSASMFGPVEVASTMWALARLGVHGEQMPSEVLALFFIATDRRLSSFKQQELSSMIWALAHMRRRPDKEWTAEFLKVTYHKVPSMNGWCLATLSWSLAELSLLPPPAWVYNYVNAARALMNAVPAPPPAGVVAGPAAAAAAAALPPPMSIAAAGAAESAVGLSAMDLGQIITALRRLNGSSSGGGGGLAKVDEFLAEAEQRLAAMEAGTGAYARQQLGAFLAMSPQQAGLQAMVVSEQQQQQPAMVVPEPSGDMGDDEEEGGGDGAAAGAAAAAARVKEPRMISRRRRSAAGSDAQPPAIRSRKDKRGGGGGQGVGVAARRLAAAAAGIDAGGDTVRQEPAAVTSSEPGAGAEPPGVVADAATAAAVAVRPGEVTRVLNGGARVTLATPPDVHVDLGGDLNVELQSGSQPGPVLWRPAAAAATATAAAGLATGIGGSNGGDGNGGDLAGAVVSAGEDVTASSGMAEIKRRLLAV